MNRGLIYAWVLVLLLTPGVSSSAPVSTPAPQPHKEVWVTFWDGTGQYRELAKSISGDN